MGEDRKITKEGDRFGKLVLLEELPSIPRGSFGRSQRVFKAMCDCGNECVVKLELVQTGRRSSCGCLHKTNAVKHGMTGTREYYSHRNLIIRCYTPEEKDAEYYKDKGIKVCERWLGKEGFINFFEDMGFCPEDKRSIDRIDPKKDYCKENCRWADDFEQANNKSNNVFIEYNGEIKTRAQWARILGMYADTLNYRIKKWGLEKAFSTPLRKY